MAEMDKNGNWDPTTISPGEIRQAVRIQYKKQLRKSDPSTYLFPKELARIEAQLRTQKSISCIAKKEPIPEFKNDGAIYVLDKKGKVVDWEIPKVEVEELEEESSTDEDEEESEFGDPKIDRTISDSESAKVVESTPSKKTVEFESEEEVAYEVETPQKVIVQSQAPIQPNILDEIQKFKSEFEKREELLKGEIKELQSKLDEDEKKIRGYYLLSKQQEAKSAQIELMRNVSMLQTEISGFIKQKTQLRDQLGELGNVYSRVERGVDEYMRMTAIEASVQHTLVQSGNMLISAEGIEIRLQKIEELLSKIDLTRDED